MSMYPFPPMPDIACGECNFAYWEKTFSDEEILKIVEIGEKYNNLQQGQIANGSVSNEIRKSKISWLELNQDTQFIYDRVRDIITTLNARYFQFDLYGFVEHIQYTVYDEENAHYDWHLDRGTVSTSPRKLSVVIQLSDPSEYDGGNLKFMVSGNPDTAKKAKGMLYAFPSFVLHKVEPVTSGTRKSLVIWLSGPKFK